MIWILILPLAILALAMFTNIRRKNRSLNYELTPNCLLTRWPVLFITGRRSVFYFHQYWNVFPEFLTEHGYEVYTLHLPWSDKKDRAQRLEEFLREHSAQARAYHLVVDTPTREEFRSQWEKNFSCVKSLNSLEEKMLEHSSLGFANLICYGLHRLKNGAGTADPHSLGISAKASLNNARLLLQKISQRAEEDVQE